MSARPPRNPPPRALIICFGFAAERMRRQPWHVAHGLAQGLGAHGFEALVVTDSGDGEAADYPVAAIGPLFERGRPTPALRAAVRAFDPGAVYLITGAIALARLRALAWSAPTTLVMASPRLTPMELFTVGWRALWAERRFAALPLANALLPGWLLRAGFRRSGAAGVLYLSEAARARYRRLGLPHGRRLRPQVHPFPRAAAPSGNRPPVIVYLGPPLALRGAWLVLDSFEAAVARGLDARLRLLLRSDVDSRSLERYRARIEASPCRERIEVVTRTLSPDALAREVAEATAFLLPFVAPVSEVPLVVLEAGLSGRPAIVLDAPGVSEYAAATGGIVAKTPEELPEALICALHRPPRERPPDLVAWTSWPDAVGDLLAQAPQDMRDYRLIALCGVDGSGKTFLLERLRAHLAGEGIATRHVWSRFRNYLSKPLLALARLTGHNRKEEAAGARIGYHDFQTAPWLARPFLALQVIDNLIDMALRYRAAPGELLLGDRCVFDTLVDLAVDTGLDDLVIDRIGPRLVRRLPWPRRVVVVRRSPALVRETRPDALADRHFARRRALYERLARRFDLPVIDNDGAPGEAVATIIRLAEGADRRPRDEVRDLRLLQ